MCKICSVGEYVLNTGEKECKKCPIGGSCIDGILSALPSFNFPNS